MKHTPTPDELLSILKKIIYLDREAPISENWKKDWVNAISEAKNLVAKAEGKS